MVKNQRYEFLDGMRGIAAFAVVFYHYALHGNIRNWFPSAPIAVDLFFCLSGFVIAFAYLQKLQSGMTYKDYFIKRLVRLYPMYLSGLVIGAIVFVTMTNNAVTRYTPQEGILSAAFNLFYLEMMMLVLITLAITYVLAKYFDEPVRTRLSRVKLFKR
ncbi:MAG: acyltransferase family protein [Methylophilaceae bacterium]